MQLIEPDRTREEFDENGRIQKEIADVRFEYYYQKRSAKLKLIHAEIL